MSQYEDIRRIAVAIYTVNRHAKTAPDNKDLYTLKKLALDKLIQAGHATKIGLHFVENPKLSKQHSTTLVRCCDFLFHMIPAKNDFDTLPHLGHQDQTSRNPQERMSLRAARDTLSKYIGTPQQQFQKRTEKPNRRNIRKIQRTTPFRSSYLDGK